MTRYRADTDALAATLTDGAVLLNLRTNRYHSLNATGTRVWELLLEARSEEEIIVRLVGEYAVAEAQARQETMTLIAELRAAELIVEREG